MSLRFALEKKLPAPVPFPVHSADHMEFLVAFEKGTDAFSSPTPCNYCKFFALLN
jgi:hypothetical protein